MNTKLLTEIKERILKEPEKFDMDWWHKDEAGNALHPNKPCGTTHCIAGWAQMLTGKKGYTETVGLRVLKLTREQSMRLFHEIHWPESFRARYRTARYRTARYRTAKTHATRAQVAAERIDHFIKTGGEE